MDGLTFELFEKHGKQIKEYFSWPEELRAALPAIEKLKEDLADEPVQKRPRRPDRTNPLVAQKPTRRRRGLRRKYKSSGVRVEWTSPMDDDPSNTKREFVRYEFEKVWCDHGRMPNKQAKILAKRVGCTIAALKNEYYSWYRSANTAVTPS